MDLGKIVGHSMVDRTYDRVGKLCESPPCLPRRYSPGQNPYPDEEHVLEPEHADALEQILIVTRLRQRRVEALCEFRTAWQSAKKTGIHQRIDDLRMAREGVAEPRRGPQD